MPIPPYVAWLRDCVGTAELWMPAVTAVVLHDGHLLLTERVDNGEWAPITGIMDPGEEPAETARREALEEASVEVSVDRLASVSVSPQVTHGNGDLARYLDLTFVCTWLSGEARVGDDENTAVRWWPLDALPPMQAYLLTRVQDALAGEDRTRFRG